MDGRRGGRTGGLNEGDLDEFDPLGGHDVKEKRVLHPATDQALPPPERDALVAGIQAR